MAISGGGVRASVKNLKRVSQTAFSLAILLISDAAWAAETGDAEKQPTATLPTVNVIDRKLNPRTEGTGSYLADSATVGGKEPVPLLEAPNSISVITRQRMDDQNMITVDDALREVTGVTVTPWDGTMSQPRSRGFPLDFSYDGFPAYGTFSANQEYDLAIYDRIEVYRGPDGIFKGSGQPGATANLVRKRGRDTFGLSALLHAGSWNFYREEIDVGGPLNEDKTLRGRFVAANQNRNFFYDHAINKRTLAYGVLDYDITRSTTASVALTHQNDETTPYHGLPAYTNEQFFKAPRSTYPWASWSRYWYETTEVTAEVEHRFESDWNIRSRIAHRSQNKRFKDGFPGPGFGVDPGTGNIRQYTRRDSDVDYDRYGFDIYASGPFALFNRKHQLLFGYAFEQFDNYSIRWSGAAFNFPSPAAPVGGGVPVFNPNVVPMISPPYNAAGDNRMEQDGVYGQVRLSVADPLIVVLGTRISNFKSSSRNAPPSVPTAWVDGARATGEVTPYAGIVFFPQSNISLYANYADIFIPQTQLTVTGKGLDPRVGKQFELGAKGRFLEGRLGVSAAAFRVNDVNRAMTDPFNPGFSIQAGEVEVNGFEFEVVGKPARNLDISLSYTNLETDYLSHQTLAGTQFDTFEPRHLFKAYVHYRFADPDMAGWSVGGGMQANSGYLGSGVPGVREQGGYAVVNAQVGYVFNKNYSVSLMLNNLFDRIYFARVGGLNTYNTYGEPRNFMATIRYKY